MFVFRVSIRAKRMEIIFLSLDVHFVENEFPYFNGQLQKKDTAPLDQSLQEIIVEEPLENGSGLHLLHKTNSSSLDECTTTNPLHLPPTTMGILSYLTTLLTTPIHPQKNQCCQLTNHRVGRKRRRLLIHHHCWPRFPLGEGTA